MQSLFDHQLEASFFVWLDNTLLVKGKTFKNFSGNFYRGTGKFNGFTPYLSPYNQWVYDSSVPGAIIPTGVYINNVLVGRGTSGSSLDFLHGQSLYSGSFQGTVSGSFSAKEINIYPTTESEEQILFEKKYFNPIKTSPVYTGRKYDDKITPCIFIKFNESRNQFISFDSAAITTSTVRAVFVADDNFIYCGVLGILRDTAETYFPTLSKSDLPFNHLGDLKSGGFNYETLKTNLSSDPNQLNYIKRVKITPFKERVNSLISPKTLGAFIDFDVETYRFPKT